jgi:hypothetical protein
MIHSKTISIFFKTAFQYYLDGECQKKTEKVKAEGKKNISTSNTQNK